MSKPLARQPVSADLTHTDAVAPTASQKGKTRYPSVVVILALNDKELFAQTQR